MNRRCEAPPGLGVAEDWRPSKTPWMQGLVVPQQ